MNIRFFLVLVTMVTGLATAASAQHKLPYEITTSNGQREIVTFDYHNIFGAYSTVFFGSSVRIDITPQGSGFRHTVTGSQANYAFDSPDGPYYHFSTGTVRRYEVSGTSGRDYHAVKFLGWHNGVRRYEEEMVIDGVHGKCRTAIDAVNRLLGSECIYGSLKMTAKRVKK